MSGIVIFLLIILGLLVAVGVTLAIMIIKLSRQISRTKTNAAIAKEKVSNVLSLVSSASSLIALIGSLTKGLKSVKRKSRK